MDYPELFSRQAFPKPCGISVYTSFIIYIRQNFIKLPLMKCKINPKRPKRQIFLKNKPIILLLLTFKIQKEHKTPPNCAI